MDQLNVFKQFVIYRLGCFIVLYVRGVCKIYTKEGNGLDCGTSFCGFKEDMNHVNPRVVYIAKQTIHMQKCYVHREMTLLR